VRSTPIVFDVWADDAPPDLRPAPVTSPHGARGVQAVRIALGVLLGAAAGMATLTVVDDVTAGPARVFDPAEVVDDHAPQSTGWRDGCSPGVPLC
jgi:hypothetical protein